MSTILFTIQSADGNLELALCPATIELRLSNQVAREFDAACEAEKSAGWFPLWRMIKAGLISAAQYMGHHFADKLMNIPLEAVTGISYTEGRLQVLTADGNLLKGTAKLELEPSFKREFQFDAPNLFSASDADAFITCYTKVKPLYDAYLAELRKSTV